MTIAVRKRKSKMAPDPYPWPLVLRTRPALDLTEDQFFDFCQLNGDLRIERTAEGEWLIMPPAGGGPSHRNAEITWQLMTWAKQDGTGVVYDSSGGFRLPNGAVRSPDASWLPKERLAQIPAAQQERFLPLCPDFALELWSPSDRLSTLRAKMAEYLANGIRLGWLLYPPARRVYVYRPDAPVEQLENPAALTGDPVLPGFTLDLREIW
jgi:Uma2 family endonuclease